MIYKETFAMQRQYNRLMSQALDSPHVQLTRWQRLKLRVRRFFTLSVAEPLLAKLDAIKGRNRTKGEV